MQLEQLALWGGSGWEGISQQSKKAQGSTILHRQPWWPLLWARTCTANWWRQLMVMVAFSCAGRLPLQVRAAVCVQRLWRRKAMARPACCTFPQAQGWRCRAHPAPCGLPGPLQCAGVLGQLWGLGIVLGVGHRGWWEGRGLGWS